MTNLPVLAREFNRHPIGGEQVQQTLLAKAFARRGYPVSMITADYGQAEGASWDSVRTHKAFALAGGLPVLRFFHPRWSGLWNAMKRSRAEIFYTSCGGAIVGQIAMFCRRYGRRMVFRVASDADCEPELPLIKYWRDKKLYEYGLRRADCVLVQSEHQRNLLQRNYGVKSVVAGMLVESGLALREFDDRMFSAIWINNFRTLKRADRLLDAAHSLADIDFHLVGGAAPGFQAYFDEICAQARTQHNVRVHGQVPYHDVNEFYEQARVYVNTSEIEGFPNSYLQAWVRGTPVVAYFDPDGLIAREGLGVAVSNQTELIDAIRSLTTDAARWREASKRCREFMKRRFSEEQVLEPYLAAFDHS
jgi:glycosyltransferase involved in cell wall biosynthesis